MNAAERVRQAESDRARRQREGVSTGPGRRRFELRIFVDIDPLDPAADGRKRANVVTSVGVAPSVAKQIDRFTWTEDANHCPADERAATRLAMMLSWLRATYEAS